MTDIVLQKSCTKKKGDLEIMIDSSSIDRISWSRFVSNHPQGNVFQTPQMYEVFEQSEGFTPILIAAVEEGEIIGILLAVIQKERNIPWILAKRAIIRGGPLIDKRHKEVSDLLLKKFGERVKSKVLITQVRNWADTSDFKSVFLKQGYKYIDHLNILLDLTQPKEVLWQNINRGKRRCIRKAYREGVCVELENSGIDLENTYLVLKEVYQRVKLPYPEIDFFKKWQNKFRYEPRFLVFSAKWENKIIAFRYVLAFKNVLYISYAGALKEYYPKFANDLLNWEVILWGKENGYTIYDFAGAGNPNVPYGVRVNKMRFGGKTCNLGRYEKIHQPVVFFFVRIAFRLWQKLQFK